MSRLFILTAALPGMGLVALLSTLSDAEGGGFGALLIPILVIILLVILNGFFVSAEFSIIGVRATQLEQQVEEGSKTAGAVLAIVESRQKQDKYIATAQLGITIASLGLAMYGEPQIAHFIEPYLDRLMGETPDLALTHTIATFTALGLLTYLHVVVGEMVPKSLALSEPATMAKRIAVPMTWAQLILSVLVRVLNSIGRLLLKVFRIPPAEGHDLVLSPDEIELIVTESAEDGLLKDEEEELIRNIFDFRERVVGQVMTPRTKVQAIASDMPREEVMACVAQSNHSRFPVYEDDLDHIVGVLHLKDLVRQTLKGSAFDLRLILRSVPAVPEDYPVEKLLAAFKNERLHMAVALDEFGGIAGIVTLEDLVEEIVGEVRDEFDQEAEPYVEIEPGVIEVAGDYLVADLVDDLYLGEEDDLPDVETVGGLIVTWLGQLPKKGDSLVHQGIRFVILEVDRRAITRARIEFPVPEQEDDE